MILTINMDLTPVLPRLFLDLQFPELIWATWVEIQQGVMKIAIPR